MRPRNSNILWVVLVIVIIAGIYFFSKKDNTPANQEQVQEKQTQVDMFKTK